MNGADGIHRNENWARRISETIWPDLWEDAEQKLRFRVELRRPLVEGARYFGRLARPETSFSGSNAMQARESS